MWTVLKLARKVSGSLRNPLTTFMSILVRIFSRRVSFFRHKVHESGTLSRRSHLDLDKNLGACHAGLYCSTNRFVL